MIKYMGLISDQNCTFGWMGVLLKKSFLHIQIFLCQLFVCDMLISDVVKDGCSFSSETCQVHTFCDHICERVYCGSHRLRVSS